MAIIGHLVNGQFVKDMGTVNIAETPDATETTSGLMSATDKKRLDNAYSTDDVASKSDILTEIFNK